MEIFAGLYVTLVFIVVCILMAICYNWRRFVQEFDEVYPEEDVDAQDEEETPLHDGPRLYRTDKEIIQLLKDNMLA
ncbi:hypothetical protein PRIPAC_96811 [Pristionchus pacificus]|uniref:Uncharacterized protein n=1 Tax=Pristionchus pacificus TaxID=54126 RepID=A0A454XRT5_PRIPA|nr:hypothetical protein PRIPAC_96811 [Pristionchus pacificus]|eukprot:PDM63778.1 hypothetical protein PRIPAC_49751 [Pristionchus pacificus]